MPRRIRGFRRFRRRYLRWYTVLAALIVVPTIVAGYAYLSIVVPHHAAHHAPVSIPRKASINEIADALAAQDIIANRLLFVLVARFSAKGRSLQSGTYEFPDDVSMLQVLDYLHTGRYQTERWVTIPEGCTSRRIARILHATCDIDSARIIACVCDANLAHRLAVNDASLEGYLFPDTYLFRIGDTPEHALAQMVAGFGKVLSDGLLDRIRASGRSVHAVLTLASIVEGETRLPEERARVAGVYYNRLQRGMRLQADPTIQYIIPDGPRRLLYADLRIKSPYNTYLVYGLPPGPINNPGLGSIEAAITPEKHDYLFFVANGRGGHTFTRNYDEHELAVAEYRKLQNKDK